MTINELTQYYSQKLAYEYRGLARADAQMQLYVKQFVADYLANQLSTCYALDAAVGAQLDILGKYIGLSRNIGLPIETSAFGLWTSDSYAFPYYYQGVWDPVYNLPTLPAAAGHSEWWYAINSPGVSTAPIAATFKAGDIIYPNGTTWSKVTDYNANGLTTYSNPATNANSLFYQYASSEVANTALPDDQYRAVLQLKIISNVSDHTLPSIMGSLRAVFGNAISVQDNRDMTLSYTVLTSFPLPLPILKQYLPRPMGVGISVTLVNPVASGGYLLTQSGDYLTTEDGSRLTIS